MVPLLADAVELGEAEEDSLRSLRTLAELPVAFALLQERATSSGTSPRSPRPLTHLGTTSRG